MAQDDKSSNLGLFIFTCILFLGGSIFFALTAGETEMVIADIISTIIIFALLFGRKEGTKFTWKLALLCIICSFQIFADCMGWFYTTRILSIIVGLVAIAVVFSIAEN